MLQSSDDGNDSNDNPGMVGTCSDCQLPAEARNGQGKGVIMQIQKMNETLKSQ